MGGGSKGKNEAPKNQGKGESQEKESKKEDLDNILRKNADKVYPLANVYTTSRILNFIHNAYHHQLVQLGISQTMKAVRKGQVQLVVLAADADPIDILLHLPLLCEEKVVPYVYVPFKAALGRAGGLNRDTSALAIVLPAAATEGPLDPQLKEIRALIDQLYV